MAADSDSSASPSVAAPAPAPLSSKKENVMPISSKIADMSESRSELLTKIQGLKQDLLNWRSKLDTQVKVYRESHVADYITKELCELKKSLNTEVEQLRLDFQELRTTLQQQQDDVKTSLKHLGMQDSSEDVKETETSSAETITEEVQSLETNNDKKTEH